MDRARGTVMSNLSFSSNLSSTLKISPSYGFLFSSPLKMLALLSYPPVHADQSLSQLCDSAAKLLRGQAAQWRCGKVCFERMTLGTDENLVDRLMRGHRAEYSVLSASISAL